MKDGDYDQMLHNWMEDSLSNIDEELYGECDHDVSWLDICKQCEPNRKVNDEQTAEG